MNPYLVADKTPTDLLETLKKFVSDNGGRERLAHRLECEMLINFNYRPKNYNFTHQAKWTDEETELLKASYKKLSVAQLANLMNRTIRGIQNKAFHLRASGELSYKIKAGGYRHAA
ncbi:MAG: hypothetical protein JWQ09_5609 [Segetibacter sp.]|nr:hypothetical protein [Segetibacter sp.]